MSSYSALVLSHGSLIGYWRLNEPNPDGGMADSSPNNLDGFYGTGLTYSITGAIANDSDTAVTNGSPTEPLAFINDDALLDLDDGPLSLEVWVKRSATQSAIQVLFNKGAGAASFRFAANNRLEVIKQGTAGAIATGSVASAITDTTTWHHVVLTKSGAATKIYVDGADVTVAGTDQTLGSNTVALRFGGTSGGTQLFPGSLDEVAVYGAVLSPAEVRQHYDTGKGARTEADSVTASDSRTSTPGKTSADSVTASDAQAKTVGHSVADSVSTTDAVAKAPQTALSDSVSASDALVKGVGLTPDETVGVTDALTIEEANALTLGDSVTASDAASQGVGKPLADSVSVDDEVTSVSGIEHTESVADSVTVGDSVTPTHTEGVAARPRMGAGIVLEPPPLRHRLDLDDFVWVMDDLDIESEMDPELRRQEEMAVLLLA